MLTAAGENVRIQSLKRGTRCVKSPSPKKQHKQSEDDKFEEWMKQVKDQFVDQKKQRREDLELRERELELQEKRFEEEKKDR